jgi:cation diffusion facilitator family transporter
VAIAAAQRVIVVAIGCNVLIAVSKFVAAAATGSSAMLAEGFHSLVDTGNELVLLLGIRRSERAADEWHPFGYGKALYFWAFIVALLFFALGGGVSIYHGVIGLANPPPLANPIWNYVVLAVAAVFESYSWWVSERVISSKKRHSDSLWQAVQRSSDASVFTVFVEDSAALIGIAVAALGVFLSHLFDNPYIDPAASVLIGVVMVAAAFVLARKCGALLVGESVDHAQVTDLRRLIGSDVAVETVGQLLTMQMGTNNVLLTAAVRFRRGQDLDQVTLAIARIETAIQSRYPAIQHLFFESASLKAENDAKLYASAR